MLKGEDAMLKTYEAVYDHGALKWIGDSPPEDVSRVVVVVDVPSETKKHKLSKIRKVLSATRGAWSVGKSIEEIDKEIANMRTDWERDWAR